MDQDSPRKTGMTEHAAVLYVWPCAGQGGHTGSGFQLESGSHSVRNYHQRRLLGTSHI